MSYPKKIKSAFERNEKALKKRPSLAQKTGKVTVRSTEGLACEIESGPWQFKVDMPAQVGGEETAPTPGIYEAAALGSCIAIMIKMWSAKLDVPIDRVEAEVEFDADIRFLFGVGNIPAYWSAIRYHIFVESTASEADIRRVLDKAHKQSHVRGDFEYPHKIERSVTIRKPQEQVG